MKGRNKHFLGPVGTLIYISKDNKYETTQSKLLVKSIHFFSNTTTDTKKMVPVTTIKHELKN